MPPPSRTNRASPSRTARSGGELADDAVQEDAVVVLDLRVLQIVQVVVELGRPRAGDLAHLLEHHVGVRNRVVRHAVEAFDHEQLARLLRRRIRPGAESPRRIFCRTSSDCVLRSPPATAFRRAPASTRSRRIGRVFENCVKCAPKAGCTAASNASIAANRSAGRFDHAGGVERQRPAAAGSSRFSSWKNSAGVRAAAERHVARVHAAIDRAVSTEPVLDDRQRVARRHAVRAQSPCRRRRRALAAALERLHVRAAARHRPARRR